jgi:hypothetical protein
MTTPGGNPPGRNPPGGDPPGGHQTDPFDFESHFAGVPAFADGREEHGGPPSPEPNWDPPGTIYTPPPPLTPPPSYVLRADAQSNPSAGPEYVPIVAPPAAVPGTAVTGAPPPPAPPGSGTAVSASTQAPPSGQPLRMCHYLHIFDTSDKLKTWTQERRNILTADKYFVVENDADYGKVFRAGGTVYRVTFPDGDGVRDVMCCVRLACKGCNSRRYRDANNASKLADPSPSNNLPWVHRRHLLPGTSTFDPTYRQTYEELPPGVLLIPYTVAFAGTWDGVSRTTACETCAPGTCDPCDIPMEGQDAVAVSADDDNNRRTRKRDRDQDDDDEDEDNTYTTPVSKSGGRPTAGKGPRPPPQTPTRRSSRRSPTKKRAVDQVAEVEDGEEEDGEHDESTPKGKSKRKTPGSKRKAVRDFVRGITDKVKAKKNQRVRKSV